jgi:hypothetical protein
MSMTEESVRLEFAWVVLMYPEMDMHEFATAYTDACERADRVNVEYPGIEDAARDFYYRGYIYLD